MANIKEQIVKFAIDDLSRFKDDDNPDLALGKMLFLSTRPNSHHLDISEEVLMKYADSIIGKWIVAEYDKWLNDVTTHVNEEVIVGIVPHDAKVEFVRADDGYLDAYVNCVISKLYATNVYDIFLKDNFRNVSVEMVTDVDADIGGEVHYFDIKATTLLGKYINPSVPKANIQIVKFSEKTANEYYSLWADKEDKKSMAKKYKIDKSEKAMSNDDWSNVDKTVLRNKILEAENTAELVNAVYLKVEEGWQDAPSEKLGYPVMQLKGDTFVYNRNALANAKARATQQNETEVLNKLDKIYAKLKLNDTQQGESKMAEETTTKLSEDEKDDKNIIMGDKCAEKCAEETKSAECADCGKKLAEETEDDKDVKDKQEDESDDDKEDDDNKEVDLADDCKKELADLEAKCAEYESKCKEYEAKCAEYETQKANFEAKLAELQLFKDNTENAQKDAIVTATLAQVKNYMSEENYAKCAESSKEYTLETVNAWRNEVLASIATNVLNAKMSENSEEHIEMDIPKEDEKHGLWD